MLIEDMTEQESLDLLSRVGFGRLGCAYKGQPYVVPMYFASSGRILYGFATFGQKIRWMRANPLVCVEAEEFHAHLGWKTVVVLGRYEELSDMPEWEAEREQAQGLLEVRDWWRGPALMTSTHRGGSYEVWYRIHIERLTGFRTTREPAGVAPASSQGVVSGRSGSWLQRLLRLRPGRPLISGIDDLKAQTGTDPRFRDDRFHLAASSHPIPPAWPLASRPSVAAEVER